MSVDVSICIVNFNTSHWIEQLLPTILDQEFTVAGRPGTLEVILVDNASKGEDSAALTRLCDERVKLVQNLSNTGYAQANNQGFHVASGTFHMILNPDTRLLPGCLQALVGHLEASPDVAMVGPLAWMDVEKTVMMPPNELPDPDLFELQTRAQTDRDVALENLKRRTAFSYPYWTATGPLEMDMLSGCAILFRRTLYEGGRPFDPGFPLYYEDTDMFMTLRRQGRKLVHLPAAQIVHFFSRSAYTHAKGAEYRHTLSQARYFEKHFGVAGAARIEVVNRKIAEVRENGTHVHPLDFTKLEVGAKAPRFDVAAGSRDYYVEVSGNPVFSLAIAMFPPDSGSFTLSQSMWDELGPNTYWIRLVSKSTFATLQAWEVDKVAWF